MTRNNMIEYTEVIHSTHRRRRWTAIEKQRIIEETYHPGTTVSLVARKYKLSPSQVFQWRKYYENGALVSIKSEDSVVPQSEVNDLMKRIKKLADIRNATFIPVRLICELEELLKRLCSHERKKYYKTQNVQLIKQRYSNTEVFQSRLKNELTIDVSSLSPEESAHKIISWAQQCHN